MDVAEVGAVTLEGRIEESDYLAAQWLHLRPRRLMRVLAIILGVLFLAGGAAQIIGWMQGDRPLSDALMLPFLLSVLAGYFLVLRWQFKRSYRGYKAIKLPLHIEVSEAGLYSRSEHGEVRLPWGLFQKYKENGRLLLLYQSGNLFHVLPKNLFKDAADMRRAQDVISRNIRSAT